MIALILALLGALIFLVFMWFRNEAVYAARSAAAAEVHRRWGEDIVKGDYSRSDHYVALHETSYDEMLWKFWRPLSSFLTELRPPP